jgi:hypothetical protein
MGTVFIGSSIAVFSLYVQFIIAVVNPNCPIVAHVSLQLAHFLTKAAWHTLETSYGR